MDWKLLHHITSHHAFHTTPYNVIQSIKYKCYPIDWIVIVTECHQNTSLYLHSYQFWDYQVLSQPVSWFNPSKYSFQTLLLSTLTMLWPSCGHIPNLCVSFTIINVYKFDVWPYDGHNVILDRKYDWHWMLCWSLRWIAFTFYGSYYIVGCCMECMVWCVH